VFILVINFLLHRLVDRVVHQSNHGVIVRRMQVQSIVELLHKFVFDVHAAVLDSLSFIVMVFI